MPSSEARLLSEQRLRSPASLWGTDFKGDDITVNALDSTKSSSFESQFNVGKCRTCTSPGEELNKLGGMCGDNCEEMFPAGVLPLKAISKPLLTLQESQNGCSSTQKGHHVDSPNVSILEKPVL